MSATKQRLHEPPTVTHPRKITIMVEEDGKPPMVHTFYRCVDVDYRPWDRSEETPPQARPELSFTAVQDPATGYLCSTSTTLPGDPPDEEDK